MSITVPNQHRSAQGRAGAALGAVHPAHTRVGYEPHGGAHERPVIVVARAGLVATGSAHTQFARQWPLPNGLSERRVVCSPDGQPATQFVRAVMAARRHFISQPRRQAIADLSHIERLSCVPVADDATKPREVSHCAGKTPQGLGNA